MEDVEDSTWRAMGTLLKEVIERRTAQHTTT